MPEIKDIYHYPLSFSHEDENYKLHLVLSAYNENELEKYLLLLSEYERSKYDNYKYHARKKSFLLGRVSAKLAINKLINVEPDSYSIISGIFTQPIVKGLKNIQVSISHTKDICTSIACNEEFPVGIDVEKINPSNIKTIKRILTEKELALVATDDIYAFILWTTKESLSKALRTGITVPLKIMEISQIEKKGEIYHAAFSNFGQYRSISFPYGNHIISICYPSVSKINETELACIEKLSIDSF